MPIGLLEVMPFRMATYDAKSKMERILAVFRVFHQAIEQIERLPQIPGPASFRVRNSHRIADRAIGHTHNRSIPLATFPRGMISS
jgi:hypothetical protein